MDALSVREGVFCVPARLAGGAASVGDFDLFKYILDKFPDKFPLNDVPNAEMKIIARDIAAGGSIEMIDFVMARYPSLESDISSMISEGIANGRANIIRHIFRNYNQNQRLDPNQYPMVALYVHQFDCFRVFVDYGARLDEQMLGTVASKGSEDLLEYLIEKKCPIANPFFLNLVQSSTFSDDQIIAYLDKYLFKYSTRGGLNILVRNAANAGKTRVASRLTDLITPRLLSPINYDEILSSCIRSFNYEGVKWALDRGASTSSTMLAIAVTGRPSEKLIELLLDKGCEVDNVVQYKAAESMLGWKALSKLHAKLPFTSDHARLVAQGRKGFADLYWIANHCTLMDGLDRADLKRECFLTFYSQENRLFFL